MSEQKTLSYKEGFSPARFFDPAKAEEYQSLLKDRIFYLSDTGISARVFNLWKKLGLIDIPPTKDREWIKLNFSDYIWLKIIQDLRKFGCSLEDIKTAKKLCLNEVIGQNRKVSEEELRNILLNTLRETNQYSEAQLKELEEELNKKSIYDLVGESFGRPLTNLDAMMMHILGTKSDAYILFFTKSDLQGETDKAIDEKKSKKRLSALEVLFYTEEYSKMDFASDPKTLFRLPHIKIPLRHYIQEFIRDESNEKYLEQIEILSKDEFTLLKEIRKGKAISITVKLRDKKIDRIEVTENFKKEAEARITETFTAHEYSEITYKVQDGKVVSFQKILKIKSE